MKLLTSPPSIRPGSRLTGRIDALAPGGQAIMRLPDHPVIFVDRGLPGQMAEVEILHCRSGFARGRLAAVLAPGPDECAPLCPCSDQCGGCRWQRLPYPEQLEWKRRHVEESLRRIGGLALSVPLPLASPGSAGFRNKMEFAFGASAAGGVALGLRALGSHEIIEIGDCPVAAPGMAEIVRFIRSFAAAGSLPAWNDESHEGFWRFLVLRSPNIAATPPGEPAACAVHLITGAPPGQPAASALSSMPVRQEKILAELSAALLKNFPHIVSITHGIRSSKGRFAQADATRLLAGSPTVRETLGSLSLSMSPDAFFQTNSRALPLLHKTIEEMARPDRRKHILDLFCGTGAIGLTLAGRCASVTGVESVPAAIRDARRNASENGIKNAVFIEARVETFLKRRKRISPAPDLVIADPPRAGIGMPLLKHIKMLDAPELLLVSCDMATLARDAGWLSRNGYRPERIQPVDMFPHTPHVECCCHLKRC